MGLQFVRAADSIGANIAEAMGRWHIPDQRRFLFIARASLYEAEHWLLRAQARDLINTTSLEAEFEEVARTLNGLIKRRRG